MTPEVDSPDQGHSQEISSDKWDEDYSTIKNVAYDSESSQLKAIFANGDEAMIDPKPFIPWHIKKDTIRWSEAKVDSQFKGWLISIPAEPKDPEFDPNVHIDWTVFRIRSDPEFASYMESLAKEQFPLLIRHQMNFLIRRKIMELGLTQRQVAKEAKMEEARLSRVLNGANFTLKTLDRILGAMGISLQDLFTSSETEEQRIAALKTIREKLAKRGIKIIV